MIGPLAASLLLVTALVVVLKERRLPSVVLAMGVVLLAMIELLDFAALRGQGSFLPLERVNIVLKSLMPVMFLLYTIVLSRRRSEGHSYLPAGAILLLGGVLAAGTVALPLDLVFLRPVTLGEKILPLGAIGYWIFLALMILCVAALVNVEAVFGSLRGTDRWRMKFELLGVSSILAGYIFYFSQGLLFRSVNMTLLPARSGILIGAAFMIGYSRAFRGQVRRVAVSRQVFYRSFTLFAVGIYLIVLGLIGEGMRRLQITLSLNLLLLVAFGSGLLLVVLILSEAIRGRVRVLLAKHFFAHKYDYREQWLNVSNALAACRSLQDVAETVVGTYRLTFGLRFAALYVGDGAGSLYRLLFAQGREGLPADFRPSLGLRGYFTETGRVLNPGDGECTPTEEEVAFFRAAELWLLVPLMAGDRVEALVVFGPQIADDRLTYEDFDLMRTVGRQAVLSLVNFRLSEQLAEAREMAAVAKISSFVIHDLKNLAYTFSLMMENVASNIGDPDFQQDLVKSIRSTVAKMNGLIAKLKAFPTKVDLSVEAVDLARLAQETTGEVAGLKPGVRFESSLGPAEVQGDAQELRKVLLNLLINACDAIRDAGRLAVATGTLEGHAFVKVEDNGVGMSSAFMQEHLFRPFRTTKDKGLGIGLYQSRQIVEAHGGKIEVESCEGEGTVFTILLPDGGEGGGLDGKASE